jgi:hypothetical protein
MVANSWEKQARDGKAALRSYLYFRALPKKRSNVPQVELNKEKHNSYDDSSFVNRRDTV